MVAIVCVREMLLGLGATRRVEVYERLCMTRTARIKLGIVLSWTFGGNFGLEGSKRRAQLPRGRAPSNYTCLLMHSFRQMGDGCQY
jgi:hypothetical protein